MGNPVAARAHLPVGYGLPADSPTLPWADIDARLREAMHYWIATVGADDRPTVRPIDGMWLDNALWFGGDPASRWRRNLEVNARAAIHLEDAERAVIVEGEVETTRPDHDLAVRLVEASNAKYDFGQTVGDYEGEALFRLRPRLALAWTLLYKDATRFTFD